jgi:hypothetical protein
MPEARQDRRRGAGQQFEGPHVAFNLRLDARSSNLDDRFSPVMQPSRVDLRDRGGGQRRAVELGKQLVDRMPERALDLSDRVARREWADVVLQ